MSPANLTYQNAQAALSTTAHNTFAAGVSVDDA
jgi:hypothetical protein